MLLRWSVRETGARVGFREENRFFGSYFLLDSGRNFVAFDEVSTERLIVWG